VPQTDLPNAAKTYRATSYVWSGYAVYDSHKPFQHVEVITEYVVPFAQQPFNVCDGTLHGALSVAGIDGWASADFISAGTTFLANCSYGYTDATYNEVVEWWPYYGADVDGLQVTPGDLMEVALWNTSQTTAGAFLLNLTTNQSVDISFSGPSSAKLTGTSVRMVDHTPVLQRRFD
jgi:hypothetical protein